MPFDWRKLRDLRQEKGDNRRYRAELTALVLSDEKVREDGRRVTQHNLLALCWVLGYCLIDEDVHHDALHFFPPTNPSLNLNDWVMESNRLYKRTGSLLLPRGVYKSTISIGYCVQLLICWPLVVTIMLMCGRGDLAGDFVEQVASFFYRPRNSSPTLFQALWPELCVDTRPRDREQFTTALRQTEPKIIAPAIWGESIEAGISGQHPTILIADDIHNNRNSRTHEARVGIVKKYNLAKKVLLPVGMEIRIGTIYGSGDLFTTEILTSRPGTVRRVIKPALRRRDGERIDQNGFPEEDEVELLFPTILSYDFLQTEYTDFESFATQYLLDEYGANEVVFSKEQMLSAMVEEAAIPLEGETVIFWRFPCQKRNWHTAAAAVGQLHRNRCYIQDVIQGHYKPSSLAKLVVNTARRHHLHKVEIEDSPGARLMTPAIHNYALTTGWNVQLEWVGREEGEEDSGERDLRIRNIEAVLSNSRLFFYAGMKHLKALMLEFSQYAMIPDNALPDVVSRVADHLPQSIAADDLEEEELSWKAMAERDHFNMIYGRGAYAPPEPEPEEVETEPVNAELQPFGDGLAGLLPGLE